MIDWLSIISGSRPLAATAAPLRAVFEGDNVYNQRRTCWSNASVAPRLLFAPGFQPLAASTPASRLQSALTFSTFAYLKFNQGPRGVAARRLWHIWEEAADSRLRSSSFIPTYPALVLLPRARLPWGGEEPVGDLSGVVHGSPLNPGSLWGGGGHVSSPPHPLEEVRTTRLRRSSLSRRRRFVASELVRRSSLGSPGQIRPRGRETAVGSSHYT